MIEGMPPGTREARHYHRASRASAEAVEFLVVSQPSSHDDRVPAGAAPGS